MKKLLIAFTAMVLSLSALETPNEALSFLLPVDWSKTPAVNLLVKIPKGYQALQPISLWDQSDLIEFIPQDEDPDNWSEIITVHKIIGRSVAAGQLVDRTLQIFDQHPVKPTVLSKETNTQEGYETATFIIKYPLDGKIEVLGAKYLSGPYDCAGAQYTIRLDDQTSEQQAVEKIQNFFKENLQTIQSDPDTP